MEFEKTIKLKEYERGQSVYVTPKRYDSTKDWDVYDDIITRVEFLLGPSLMDGNVYVDNGEELDYFVNFEYSFSNSRSSLNFLLKVVDGTVDLRVYQDTDWRNPDSSGFSIFDEPLKIEDPSKEIVFGVVIDWREFGNVAVYINDEDLIELSTNFSLHDGARTIFGFGARVIEYDESNQDSGIYFGYRTRETEREDVRSFSPMLTNKTDTKYKTQLKFEKADIGTIKPLASYKIINSLGVLEGLGKLREYRSTPFVRQYSEIKNFTQSDTGIQITNGDGSTKIEKSLSDVVGNAVEDVIDASMVVSSGMSPEGRGVYNGYGNILDSLTGLYNSTMPNSISSASNDTVVYGEHNTPTKMTLFQTRFYVNGNIPTLTRTSVNDRLSVREQVYQLDIIRGHVPENEVRRTTLSGLDAERISSMREAISNTIPYISNSLHKTISLVLVIATTLEGTEHNTAATLFMVPNEVWGDAEEVNNKYEYLYKKNLKFWNIPLASLTGGGVSVSTYINSVDRKVGLMIDDVDYGYIYDDNTLEDMVFGEQRTSPISVRGVMFERGFNIKQNNSATNTKIGMEFIWDSTKMSHKNKMPSTRDINYNALGSNGNTIPNINDDISEFVYFNSVETHGDVKKLFNNEGFGIDFTDNSHMHVNKLPKHSKIYKRMTNGTIDYSLFGRDENDSEYLSFSESPHNTIYNMEDLKNIPNSEIFLYKQIKAEDGEFRLGREIDDYTTLGLKLTDLNKKLSNYFVGLSLKSLLVNGDYDGYILRDIKLGVEWDANENRKIVMYYVCSSARMQEENVSWLKENFEKNEQHKVFRQEIPLLAGGMDKTISDFRELDVSVTKLPNSKLLLTINDIHYGDILPYNGFGRELRSNSNLGGYIDGKHLDGLETLGDTMAYAIEAFPTANNYDNSGRNAIKILIKEHNLSYKGDDYYPLPDKLVELRPFSQDSTLRDDMRAPTSINPNKMLRVVKGGNVFIYNRGDALDEMSLTPPTNGISPIYTYNLGNETQILTKNQDDDAKNYGKLLRYNLDGVSNNTFEYEGTAPIVSEMYSGTHDFRKGSNSSTQYVYLRGKYYTIEGLTGSQKIIEMDGNGNKLAEIAQLPSGESAWEDISALSEEGYIVAASRHSVMSINPSNPSSAQVDEFDANKMIDDYKVQVHDVGGGYAVITFRTEYFVIFDAVNGGALVATSPFSTTWDRAIYAATRASGTNNFQVLEVSHNYQTKVFSYFQVFTISKIDGTESGRSTQVVENDITKHNMGAPALWGFGMTHGQNHGSNESSLIYYTDKNGRVYATATAKITTHTVSGTSVTEIEHVKLGEI